MLAALILIGGASLILLFPNRLSPHLLRTALLLTSALAILSLWAALSPLAPWGAGEIPGQPLFSTSGSSLGFSLTMGLVLILVLGYQLSSTQLNPLLVPGLGRAIFFTGLGMVFFDSQNALAILLAWGLLDFALLWILSQSDAPTTNLIPRAAGWNLLGGMIWLSFAFTGISFPLLLLAFWVRVGLYPAANSLSLLEDATWPGGRIMQLLLILCGGYLLVRFPGLALTGIWQVIALILAVLAILWGILRLRKEGGGDKPGFYMTQLQMGYLALAYILHSPLTTPIILLSILSIVLPWLVLDIAKRGWTSTPGRWPRLLLVAVLVLGLGSWLGLPLTPGFSARVLLYQLLWQEGLGWVVILGSVVILLLTPRLIDLWATTEFLKREESSRSRLSWMVILGMIVLVLGIYPGLFLGSSYGPAIWDILSTMSQPELALILLATLLPLALGYLLHRQGRGWGKWPSSLANLLPILDGEWFYSSLDMVGEYIGREVRVLASWGEGRGGLGWYLLFGLLLALWALSP